MPRWQIYQTGCFVSDVNYTCYMRSLTTPVALIVFNRPACTARVLESLAKQKPKTLFVIGDGPRSWRPGDREAVSEVRKLFTHLSWQCDVHLNLAEENLGCRKRVTSGLDWVFTHVEDAVILEDDIVPAEGFLPFCEELLDRYRDDTRIGSISGTDFTAGAHTFTTSYSFSRYNLFWGWATWRRAWAMYDDSMMGMASGDDTEAMAVLRQTFDLWRERTYWGFLLRRAARGHIDSWGYRWLFSCWKAGLLGIQPAVSIVENIGTGPDATHTRHGVYGIKPASPLPHPLRHPSIVVADRQLDRVIEDRIYSRSFRNRVSWLWNRIGRH